MTAGMAQVNLRAAGLKGADLRSVDPGEQVSLGGFKVELVTVSHTLPGAAAVVVSTPCGRVVHTGDFHFDQTPPNGHFTDIHRLAELGRQGVSYCSPIVVMQKWQDIPRLNRRRHRHPQYIQAAKGRVIMVGYGASLYRLQQVINTAAAFGRRTYISWPDGRALLDLASEVGHLSFAASALFDPKADEYLHTSR